MTSASIQLGAMDETGFAAHERASRAGARLRARALQAAVVHGTPGDRSAAGLAAHAAELCAVADGLRSATGDAQALRLISAAGR